MVSLTKNQTISLSKVSPALSQLTFGLGWDPLRAKKKGYSAGCSPVARVLSTLMQAAFY